MMIWPLSGDPVPLGDYFTKGNARLHAIGILGGAIWNVGMSFSIIAANAAGAALSYGLGQGATMIGAFWGVFIWKEFHGAPPGTSKLLARCLAFTCSGWESWSHPGSEDAGRGPLAIPSADFHNADVRLIKVDSWQQNQSSSSAVPIPT